MNKNEKELQSKMYELEMKLYEVQMDNDQLTQKIFDLADKITRQRMNLNGVNKALMMERYKNSKSRCWFKKLFG